MKSILRALAIAALVVPFSVHAADELSEATVKTHITAILRTLGVNSRTEAVLLVQRMGWFDDTQTNA